MALTIGNINIAPLHELTKKLRANIDACGEQMNGIHALPFAVHPIIVEAARQQLIIDKYKTNIVILTNSEEAAVSLVNLALAFSRTAPERNETVFVSVMDDVLARLARGDSVADVTEWVSGLQPDN